MALTKSFLLELGIEASHATAIMTEHGKMQTTYLKQIEGLEENLATESEKLAAAQQAEQALKASEAQKRQELESAYQAKLKHMALESKSASIVTGAKPHDQSLVLSFIKTDDLDVESEGFEVEFKKRLDAVKTEKPFLFVQEAPADNKDEQDEKEAPLKQGFVPMKPAESAVDKPAKGYQRIGMDSLPNISNIFNFDKE